MGTDKLYPANGPITFDVVDWSPSTVEMLRRLASDAPVFDGSEGAD